ncbi:MAG: glycoside hydrolase family 88 protein [Clostridia bacterium]|nr:glycoside hydrolase family 88 protein [Clostridia bacterium]
MALNILLTSCNKAEVPGGDDDDTGSNDNTEGGEISFEEKYSSFELTREKLEYALAEAIKKIDYALPTFTDKFPSHNSKNNVYSAVSNTGGWNTGFWTGILWHAYELTGNTKYLDVATSQIDSYYYRIENKIGVNHHDMGFVFMPSCVAAYKLTNNETAKEAALLAADNLITRYHESSKFIQAWGNVGADDNYRLIVDCLMNIPLLYWASEQTGDDKYRDIAYNHFKTTLSVCYREDGSTYHTYYFDKETGEPLRGVTAQGASDDSTWSRGQAWGMYGPLLTYIYVEDEAALDTFCATADYYLHYLPEDYVAYWDLSFTSGDEPRDSSSAAIALCALLEGIKHLDENDSRRELYANAAKRIMNSLIDNYITKDVPEANGLLLHGTYSKPGGLGVDEMNIWGDYFYMEALHRMLDPEWELYW